MRARGYTVVLHDVQKGDQTKQMVIDHVLLKDPVKAVVAQEPYGHQEGFHIHVFYRLKNPSAFKAQLKHWVMFWKSGRVQVDAMSGEISQACRYLTQEDTKKDKLCDPSPWYFPTEKIKLSPAEEAERYFEWFLTTPIDAFHMKVNQVKSQWDPPSKDTLKMIHDKLNSLYTISPRDV